MTEKYGYWETNGLKFEHKVEALVYASQNDTKVKFVYHNEVWKNFDRSVLGKIPLNQLYKERAQQLRDTYDYLVLYYSGGADSHNILMTFINNNIKLDEIIVKWPKPLVDGKLYTANTTDKTSRNIWSEWDYVIKPTLNWLKENHPKIKITVKDYTEQLTIKNLEKAFESSNHTRAGLLQSFATIESFYSKKGIGHIFGIDKPTLVVSGSDVFMVFNDLATTMLYADKPEDADPDNIECFYWSPDFPLLTFEMAYQVSEYYNINKDKKKFLELFDTQNKPEKSTELVNLMVQFQNNVAKSVCYDTWDFTKFQADKPISVLRQDKWFWFFESSEFESLKEVFYSGTKNITNSIDKKFLSNFSSSCPGIKTMIGGVYFVRKFD